MAARLPRTGLHAAGGRYACSPTSRGCPPRASPSGHRSRQSVRPQGLPCVAVRASSKRAEQQPAKSTVAPNAAAVAAPSVEPAETKTAGFSWTKQWYVVGIADQMAKDKPHAVDVLGGQFVVWCDEEGNWHAAQDLCPHRLAPMSEGKIVGNTLQCSYHGWRFAGDGACVRVPQATEDQFAHLASNKRACLKTHPVTVRHGLLWLWPDSGEARFIESAAQAVAQDVPPQDSEQEKWMEFLPMFAREFPYSMQTLFDNALDPSHVPWSHHTVIGNRDRAGPLLMKVKQGVSPDGLVVDYSTDRVEASATSAKAQESQTTTLSYLSPHTLVYDTVRQSDGTKSKLLAYVTPTTPGRCKVYSISLDTRHTFKTLMTKLTTPTWLAHLIFMKAGDGDVVLLKTQESLLPRLEHGWRQFFLPTQADLMVSNWRKWLEKFTSKAAHPYMLAGEGVDTEVSVADGLAKEQLLDRFHQHTADCPACSGAMQSLGRLKWAATAAAVISAQLGLLSALQLVPPALSAASKVAAAGLQLGPVTLPMHVVLASAWAVAAAMFYKLAGAFETTRQEFIFKDYVHAYI